MGKIGDKIRKYFNLTQRDTNQYHGAVEEFEQLIKERDAIKKALKDHNVTIDVSGNIVVHTFDGAIELMLWYEQLEKEEKERYRLADLGMMLDVPDLNPGENVEFRVGHRRSVQVVVKKDDSSISFNINLKDDISGPDIYGRISEQLSELRGE